MTNLCFLIMKCPIITVARTGDVFLKEIKYLYVLHSFYYLLHQVSIIMTLLSNILLLLHIVFIEFPIFIIVKLYQTLSHWLL